MSKAIATFVKTCRELALQDVPPWTFDPSVSGNFTSNEGLGTTNLCPVSSAARAHRGKKRRRKSMNVRRANNAEDSIWFLKDMMD